MDQLNTVIQNTVIQAYQIPGTGFSLDLPSYGGFFANGVFSAIGLLMYLFLVVLIVAWVGFSLYGAYSIVGSMGDPQKIEKGLKIIKSVWIGISYFLIFFLIITFGAVFIGVGAPWNWAKNLQQCPPGGPAAGRFFFQGRTDPMQNPPPGTPTSDLFITKPYNIMLEEFAEAHPTAVNKLAHVACCEDDVKGEYIDIFLRQGDIPDTCQLAIIDDY